MHFYGNKYVCVCMYIHFLIDIKIFMYVFIIYMDITLSKLYVNELGGTCICVHRLFVCSYVCMCVHVLCVHANVCMYIYYVRM